MEVLVFVGLCLAFMKAERNTDETLPTPQKNLHGTKSQRNKTAADSFPKSLFPSAFLLISTVLSLEFATVSERVAMVSNVLCTFNAVN